MTVESSKQTKLTVAMYVGKNEKLHWRLPP